MAGFIPPRARGGGVIHGGRVEDELAGGAGGDGDPAAAARGLHQVVLAPIRATMLCCGLREWGGISEAPAPAGRLHFHDRLSLRSAPMSDVASPSWLQTKFRNF
jgi:hypothetical protein